MPKKDPSIPKKITNPKLKKGVEQGQTKNNWDVRVFDSKCCDEYKTGPNKGQKIFSATRIPPESKMPFSERPKEDRPLLRSCEVKGKLMPQSVLFPKKVYKPMQKEGTELQAPYIVMFNTKENRMSSMGSRKRKSDPPYGIIIPKKDGLRFLSYGGNAYTLRSCTPKNL